MHLTFSYQWKLSARRIGTLVLLFTCLGAEIGWGATARTALVIGNRRYEALAGELKNSVNDAKAVAQALRDLGFSVIERRDLDRDEFLRAVEAFRKTLPGSEVALFYYAGHGISVAGSNYLVPLRSGFQPGGDLSTLRMQAETRLFNAEQIVGDMSAGGAPCNLVILDACRNTPLARIDEGTRAWKAQSGLVEMTPPAGSLIAFAADVGQAAFDGDGSNGLYTEELLKYLRTPGLTIEQVFKRTRAGVVQRSAGGQLPAEYSRLVGEDIYLAGLSQSSSAEAAPSATPPSESGPDKMMRLAKAGENEACAEAIRQWKKAVGPGDYAVAPLTEMLESAKENLQASEGPSTRVVTALMACEAVLELAPETVPESLPARDELIATAHNRHGDALLLLGRNDEALEAFNAALPLAPNDAYVLYNRGRAFQALGNLDAARDDFNAAMSEKFEQPEARELAKSALETLK